MRKLNLINDGRLINYEMSSLMGGVTLCPTTATSYCLENTYSTTCKEEEYGGTAPPGGPYCTEAFACDDYE